MSRKPGWKELSVGLTAAGGIIAVALMILVYGRPGRLHGKTVTVYATSDAARGVIGGTEVWLDGQKIGLVKGVTFQSASVTPNERLLIKMDVLDKERAHLRLDSKVDIRAGTSIIGDPVIYLSSGSVRARSVLPNDTIHGGQQADAEEMTSEAALVAKEFPGIMENVKLLAAQLQTTEGTLGAFGVDMRAPQMQEVRMRSTRLIGRMFNGQGTLGKVMGGGSSELQVRAKLAMAQVDSIRALLASNDHSLGRFRRDSTLVLEIGRVRSELADIQALAESPRGTIGRMRTDTAIVHNIHGSMAELDSLFADVKKHPFRYIIF